MRGVIRANIRRNLLGVDCRVLLLIVNHLLSLQVRWGATEGFKKGNQGLHLTGPSSAEHRLKEATKRGKD